MLDQRTALLSLRKLLSLYPIANAPLSLPRLYISIPLRAKPITSLSLSLSSVYKYYIPNLNPINPQNT